LGHLVFVPQDHIPNITLLYLNITLSTCHYYSGGIARLSKKSWIFTVNFKDFSQKGVVYIPRSPLATPLATPKLLQGLAHS
jgi:hypothetical protein